jgi:MOSC domain-containing protein YiiM
VSHGIPFAPRVCILSVNVGQLTPSPHTSAPAGTAIDKHPADRIEVRAPGPKKVGLGNDVVGDQRHHGGDFQAVYAVAREELDWWAGELGRELGNGIFGENLTTTGLDGDGAVVGERWVIGDVDGAVVLEATGPRIPCRTFAGHMGERGWVRRFTERGPHSHSPRHRATARPHSHAKCVFVSAPARANTH